MAGQAVRAKRVSAVLRSSRISPPRTAFRRKAAEDNVRVGNRRLGSAPAVTRRPWFGAGALRTDVQPAAFVEPSDAAAAGSYLDDVEDGDADGEPLIIAAPA